LNLAYFGVEFGVAVAIGSVSLFADSIDFLEDASVNFLIAVSLVITSLLSEIGLCSSVSITTATKVPTRAIPMHD
jgi:hypothetical protein